MPELPETETIARDLDREIRGRGITEVVVEKSDVLRGATPAELASRVTGREVQRAWRRAKLVVLDLDSGDRIVVQPRFTGALLLARGPLPDAEAPYSTLRFALDDGRDLHYREVRGGRHSELDWASRAGDVLRALFPPDGNPPRP